MAGGSDSADGAPQNTGEIRSPEFLAQVGKGRPKGTQNKMTKALKEMILQALDDAGGVEYLVKQADENPTAFLRLVGKVLPLQLTGENGGAIQVERVERIFTRPEQYQQPSIQ
jgi:hypothetical protein